MKGLITKRNLFVNAPTIINEFGVLAYARCVIAALLSRRQVTFLDCVLRLSPKPLAARHTSTGHE